MSGSLTGLHGVSDYVADFVEFIRRQEAHVRTPYYDPAKEHNASIGDGINIDYNNRSHLLLVLDEIGLIDSADAYKILSNDQIKAAENAPFKVDQAGNLDIHLDGVGQNMHTSPFSKVLTTCLMGSVLVIVFWLFVGISAPYADPLEFDTSEPTAPGSHIYQLAMSKDDKLCGHMLKLFNDDLAKYGREKYSEHEEFNKIPWRDAQYSYENDGRIRYKAAKGALFDLNNDGVEDFVVKKEGSLGGIPRDSLYILDSEAANRADRLVNRELIEAKNKIKTPGWVYLLGAPLQGDGAYFGILEPFKVDATAYLYLRPRFESRRKGEVRDQYSVIARYKKGVLASREDTGEMDDICYFKRIQR